MIGNQRWQLFDEDFALWNHSPFWAEDKWSKGGIFHFHYTVVWTWKYILTTKSRYSITWKLITHFTLKFDKFLVKYFQNLVNGEGTFIRHRKVGREADNMNNKDNKDICIPNSESKYARIRFSNSTCWCLCVRVFADSLIKRKEDC